MGVVVDVVRVACNTSTGTQDITGSLGGLSAKAAIFIFGNAVTDGTAASHAVQGWGAATGASNRWCIASSSENGVGTTDTQRQGTTDECVMIHDQNGNVDGEADFSAWITNGVRINWGNAPASAYLLEVWLFAGTDLSVHANMEAVNLVQDATADVTAPGFEPDLVFLGSTGTDMNDTLGNHHHINFGVGANMGTDYQGSGDFVDRYNQATSSVALMCSDSYCVRNTFPGSDGAGLEIGSYDSSGFSLTSRLGAWGTDVGYLALSFGGAVDHWAGSVDSPTSTGDDAQTGPGFTPQAVFGIITFAAAYDTREDDGDGGAFGLAAFTPTSEFCYAVACEDGQGTSDTQTLSDNTAINVPEDDGTTGFVASYSSMDANGWTLNFTATDTGTTRKWVFIAIEEESAGAQTVTLDTLTLASSAPSLTVSPGAVTTALDTLSLASSAVALSVSPGAVSVAVNTLTLAGSAEALSVAPGAISVGVNTLTLAGSAEGLTVTSGISVALNTLSLAGSEVSLSVSPGAASVSLGTISLVSTIVALAGVTSGAVQTDADTAAFVMFRDKRAIVTFRDKRAYGD